MPWFSRKQQSIKTPPLPVISPPPSIILGWLADAAVTRQDDVRGSLPGQFYYDVKKVHMKIASIFRDNDDCADWNVHKVVMMDVFKIAKSISLLCGTLTYKDVELCRDIGILLLGPGGFGNFDHEQSLEFINDLQVASSGIHYPLSCSALKEYDQQHNENNLKVLCYTFARFAAEIGNGGPNHEPVVFSYVKMLMAEGLADPETSEIGASCRSLAVFAARIREISSSTVS